MKKIPHSFNLTYLLRLTTSKFGLLLCVVFFFGCSLQVVGQTNFYSQDFETNNDWSLSPTPSDNNNFWYWGAGCNVHGGANSLQIFKRKIGASYLYCDYGNNTTSEYTRIASKIFDFSTITIGNTISFKYWVLCNGESGYDDLIITVNGVTSDGPLIGITSWQQRSIDLSSYAGNSSVPISFKWRNDSSLANLPAARIDDITITITPPPTITSFTPSSGCTNSGTFTITGTNLSGATAVTVGGSAATITSSSATQIVVTVGNGTTGLIKVTTVGGTFTSTTNFTVNSPVITTQPTNTAVLQGGSIVLTTTTSSSLPTYQWQYSSSGTTWANIVNGTPIGATYSNATTAQLGIVTTSTTPVGVYYYRNTVIAAGCTISSASATLTVSSPGCSNTTQFPSSTIPGPVNSVPITLSTNQWQTEYNAVSISNTGTYISTYSGGGYLTVRSGTYNGPIIAYGNSPLTWTASTTGNYYIHYNTNAFCGTATTSFKSTLQCSSCATIAPCVSFNGNFSCATADSFCTGTNYNYCNTTNVTSLGAGGIYGCLGSTPNPSFFYLKTGTSGNIDIALSQTNTAGIGLDIDFVCWGPFASQASICGALSASKIIDCSYSTASSETCNIPNAVPGQWYLLLITNFSNQQGSIAFSQTGGGGASDCSILCTISSLTATAATYITSNNTYTASGQVIVNNPPTSGTLTLSSSCGGSVVFSAPFATTINYTIPNISGVNNNCFVTASFSADPTCTITTAYTASFPCSSTVTASGSTTICSGNSVALNANTGTNYIYQWKLNGTNISGATLPNLSASLAGSYSVDVTNANNCTTTSGVITITVTSCTTTPFSSCNLVVDKVGDGTNALSNSASLVSVDEITILGVPVQFLATQYTGSQLLTQSGTSTSTGYLNSYNGLLAVPGYNKVIGTLDVNNTNTKVTNVIDSNTSIVSRTLFPTSAPMPFSGDSFRSVIATSATTFYCSGNSSSGNSGGIWYYNGSFFQIYSTIDNIRNIKIFNGQLYFSTGSTNTGIYKLGEGLPTTIGQSATQIIATSSSPYGFSMSPDGCTLYIADENGTNNNTGGGIQKWTKQNNIWTRQYTFLRTTRGLVIDYSGINPLIYATTNELTSNKIIKIIDTGSTSTINEIKTAESNYVYRGIDFTPNSYTPITITQQPANISTCINQAQSLSVTASCLTTLTYQWYSNTANDYCGATLISGASSAIYTPPVSANGVVYFFVKIVGSCASVVTSNIVGVTVSNGWCNTQSPASGTFCQLEPYIVYGRVYRAGVTDGTGQGAGIIAELGYSTTNSNPNTWTNWQSASFNVKYGTNDEYQASLTGLAPGTYYYAYRFAYAPCGYQYGGYSVGATNSGGGGGFWDGVTYVSGILTVTNGVGWCNTQFPSSGTICQSGSYTVYGRVFKTGVTEAAGQGTGITADLGYSTSNTNPNTWTNWQAGTFNIQVGNNDEYQSTLTGLAPGSYYYAYRYRYSPCGYDYGGYSSSGGSFWNGSTYVSSILLVNALPTVTISGTSTICNGSNTTFTASGGNSYSWGNGLGTNAAITVNPISTTTYTVTGTDSNTCSNTATKTVTVNPKPITTLYHD